MKARFKEVPLTLNSVALGTIGLAGAADLLIQKIPNLNEVQAFRFTLFVYIFCIALALFYMIINAIKHIYYYKSVKENLKKPNTIGSFGINFLSTLAINNGISWIINKCASDEIKHQLLYIPNLIVILVVIAQFIYSIYFIKNILMKPANWQGEVFTTWFVPLVGISICITHIQNLGNILPLLFFQIIWFWAFAFFIWFFPLVLYKFFFKPHPNSADIPSMAIFASPANLMALGFLVAFDPSSTVKTVFNNQIFYNIISVYLFCLSSVGIMIYMVILAKTLRLHRLKMSWSALTFPASISAIGTLKFADLFFHSSNTNFIGINEFFTAVAVVLFTISLCVVAFINIIYLELLFEKLISKKKFKY
ncbi:hypothetical protein GE118_00890 [Mycoplasma sp. NEAQ87857]|uniref:SLAC1 family transporter n=1 Tax=Mycoplasma sp. NEAQ87857 TaxID=2683967 RepID=UPI0013176CE4|nr:hypothetical protein [Mycoplasma sp. NEAQ87857]QGZ97358.1 hypothetical protein GE118_00890 [Mycoplasma sp. NEAQ87857]